MVDFNKLIGTVNDDEAFKLPVGSIKSLAELIDSLNSMDEGIFSNHVNDEKNDFALWIKNIFGDELLSKRVELQKSKESIVQEIKTRLEQARKSIESGCNPDILINDKKSDEKPKDVLEQSIQASPNNESMDQPKSDNPLTAQQASIQQVPGDSPQSTQEQVVKTQENKPAQTNPIQPVTPPTTDQDLDVGLDEDLDSGLDVGLDSTSHTVPSNVPETNSADGLDAGLDGDLDSGLDSGLDAGLDSVSSNVPSNIPETNPADGLDAGLDEGLDIGMGMPPVDAPPVLNSSQEIMPDSQSSPLNNSGKIEQSVNVDTKPNQSISQPATALDPIPSGEILPNTTSISQPSPVLQNNPVQTVMQPVVGQDLDGGLDDGLDQDIGILSDEVSVQPMPKPVTEILDDSLPKQDDLASESSADSNPELTSASIQTSNVADNSNSNEGNNVAQENAMPQEPPQSNIESNPELNDQAVLDESNLAENEIQISEEIAKPADASVIVDVGSSQSTSQPDQQVASQNNQETNSEEVQLSDDEKILLKTPNEELNPSKLFKKLKLEKKLKIDNKSPAISQDSSEKPKESDASSSDKSDRSGDVKLTDSEKVLLKTPNEELDPSKLFKKLKLEKKLKTANQQISQVSMQKTNAGNSALNVNLTDDEKVLLKTPNEELDPAKLFKKLKLEKKLKLKKEPVSPIPEKTEETIKKSEAKKIIQPPINILDMSDKEFNKLIGIGSQEDYVAEVSKKNVVKLKKRKNLLTGVPGFDDLVVKGIIEGSSILVSGGPGSGKTTFCIQQLGWAAEHGEKCLFLTLEESEERLVEHMKSYGLNPEKYLEDGTLKINKLDSFKLSRSVEALLANAKGELMIDIDPIMDIIPEGFKPDRIVLDSLSSIAAAFAGQPEVYRIYVEQLFLLFEKFDTTSFIITEIQGSESEGHGGVEDFIADGVINFYNIKKGMKRQPAMEIFKMRGVSYTKKIVPFAFIPGKGIEIYPLEEVFYDG